jgi:hypothetical protein
VLRARHLPHVCWDALGEAKASCAFDFCPDYCDATAQCDPEQDRELCDDLCNGGAVLIAADAPDCLDDVIAAYECLSETTCTDHGEQGPCGDLLAAVEDCKLTVVAEQE